MVAQRGFLRSTTPEPKPDSFTIRFYCLLVFTQPVPLKTQQPLQVKVSSFAEKKTGQETVEVPTSLQLCALLEVMKN